MAKDEHGREYIEGDDGVRRYMGLIVENEQPGIVDENGKKWYTGLVQDNRVPKGKSRTGIILGVSAAAVAAVLGYWALKGFKFKQEVDLPQCERKVVGTYTNRMFGEDLKGTLYTPEGKEAGSLAFERKEGKWVLDTKHSDIAHLVEDVSSVSGLRGVLSSGRGAYDAAKSGHYLDAFRRAAEGVHAGKKGYDCVAEIKKVGEKFY
jgi:hypothetical protein